MTFKTLDEKISLYKELEKNKNKEIEQDIEKLRKLFNSEVTTYNADKFDKTLKEIFMKVMFS